MKNFLLLFIISFGLIGCSSLELELESVSSSEDETQRILSMNLSHEENLNEARKLQTPRMVSVVSLLLTNARDEKLKSELNQIESEKFADMVITDMNGLRFAGVEQDVIEKTSIFAMDSVSQIFYLEGIKDPYSGSVLHKLNLSIIYKSKAKRNYISANLCDKWGRCEDNLLNINVISSIATNCDKSTCKYNEVIELVLDNELLEKSKYSGLTIRYNFKNKSNKVKVSSAYLMGYLKVVK
jgi:hypothetical protein